MIEAKDFCIIIMSHGRADNLVTVDTLRNLGCTSEIIILIDNEDSQIKEYYDNFDGKRGCKVMVFDKKEASTRVDVGDLIPDRKVVLFARNTVHRIAKEAGYTYFIILEDDYHGINYRWVKYENNHNVLKATKCVGLDRLFCNTMQFYIDNPILSAVCYAQDGDYIGGADTFGSFNDNRFRKAMNSFFCSTERPVEWYGRLNDDVNGYILGGMKGRVFLTFREVSINQELTQQASAGMTEIYKSLGTYAKSFYSVMYTPSCVRVSAMGRTNMRIHHKVDWNSAVPKIVSSRFKKSENKVERIEVI